MQNLRSADRQNVSEKTTEKTEHKTTKLNLKLGHDAEKEGLSVEIEGLSQQEKDRIRVMNDLFDFVFEETNDVLQIAFADGYLAAAKKPEKANKWKAFSAFKDALAFLLMIVILLGILGMFFCCGFFRSM